MCVCGTQIKPMIGWRSIAIPFRVMEHMNPIDLVFRARGSQGLSRIEYPCPGYIPPFVYLKYTHYGNIMPAVITRGVPLIIIDAGDFILRP